jgi:hypothetical protein
MDSEPIAVKQFQPSEGALEGAEKVLSTCRIGFSLKHFSPTPYFVHRVHTRADHLF